MLESKPAHCEPIAQQEQQPMPKPDAPLQTQQDSIINPEMLKTMFLELKNDIMSQFAEGSLKEYL